MAQSFSRSQSTYRTRTRAIHAGQPNDETTGAVSFPIYQTSTFAQSEPGVDKGYLFLGVKAGPGQDGPMISDDRGRLVWFHRVPFHTSAFDFRTQLYRGRHVLTWWQGPVLAGEGFGEGIIYDDHYQPLATGMYGCSVMRLYVPPGSSS